MSYSNGIITAPVSIYDVQRAIGASSPDVGTLCKHANVNMWAKYKPVRLYQVIDTVTGQWDFTNNKWLSTATWWKGLSGAFAGITPPSGITSWALLLSAYDGGNNGWTYDQPQGGIHPFRLQDFAGYNHLANKPVENFYIAPQVIQDGHFTASAIMSQPDANGDYISLADLTNLAVGDLYFGVAFYSGTTMKCRVTADEAGAAGVMANFSGSGNMLPLGNYKVYPFLSNKKLALSDTSDPTGLTLYTCPCVNYANTEIIDHNQGIDITLSAAYTIGSTTSIDIELEYNISSDLSNCKIYILPMTYWNNPDSGTSHAAASTSTFTLDHTETSRLAHLTVTAGSYFVYATFATGTYWRKTNILEDIAPQ